MTPTWFCTRDRLEALDQRVRAWIGTPFLRDSCEIGVGVCCSRFVGAVFREVGACEVDIPAGSTAHARFAVDSIVVPFMSGLSQFREVTEEARIPGDILGIRIGRVVHHLGVMVHGTGFAHALDKVGVVVNAIDDATWASRITHVWRLQP